MPQKRLPFPLYPLHPGFVPPKPKHSVDDARVLALQKTGRLCITRKRDGYYHSIVVGKSDVKIYTRGVVDVTAQFPHIVREIRGLNLPSDTLLIGEIVCLDELRNDDFPRLVRIAKSDSVKAVQLQEQLGFARFCAFGTLIWGGVDVSLRSHEERQGLVKNYVSTNPENFVFPVEILDCTFAEAEELVRKNKWEGLVLYDTSQPTAYRLDGKLNLPPRPDGCWKCKPITEDDFIAYKWVKGTGKNKDRMGKLFIAQISPRTGEQVLCGEVGGGFSDPEREEFARATYPLVIQVEFQKRFASGALRSPQFMRRRDDKRPEECLAPEKE